MHSRCRCSDCHISSKLFPRNCEGRIVLPLLFGHREHSADQSGLDVDEDESSSTGPTFHTTTLDVQEEQTMNILGRTRRKRIADDLSKLANPEARKVYRSSPIPRLPEPLPRALFDEPSPSTSEVTTELCPPVLTPQTDPMSKDSAQNSRPVQIRWNSRKTRQGFTQQASDGPKSRFRHYNAECT